MKLFKKIFAVVITAIISCSLITGCDLDEVINEFTDNSSTSSTTETSKKPTESKSEVSEKPVSSTPSESTLTFRNQKLLNQHYQKHGIEMGFSSAEEYEKAANKVVSNPKSLHKYEKEDGDDVYFLESSKEFVVVSTDGYIRTYYYATLAYFNRQ